MQVSRSRWQLLQDFGRLDCGRARSAHKERGGFAGCHRTCRREDVEKEERGELLSVPVVKLKGDGKESTVVA